MKAFIPLSTWVFDTIKEFEGLRLTPYLCPAGKWTVGWGHTKNVDPKKAITEVEAERLLQEDLSFVAVHVMKLVTSEITQGMFDALVDFAFNVGLDGDSTLLRLVNEGRFDDAAKEFHKWEGAHVNGKLVKLVGLVNRREKERLRFLSKEIL